MLCRIIKEVGNYELRFSNISEVMEKQRVHKRNGSVTYVDLKHLYPWLVDVNWILC